MLQIIGNFERIFAQFMKLDRHMRSASVSGDLEMFHSFPLCL